MNFKEILPFKYLFPAYLFSKNLDKRLAQIQQSLYFLENKIKIRKTGSCISKQYLKAILPGMKILKKQLSFQI